MTPALLVDLKRCLIGLAVGVTLGWMLDDIALGLAGALAVLLARQLRATWRLHRWLRERETGLPHGSGMLGDIGHHLGRVQRQARKRKRRLKKVVARFEQAAEANPDGALIVDGAGRIEWMNKAAARLLALRQQQDKGQPIVNLIRNPAFLFWLAEKESSEAGESLQLDSPRESSPHLSLRLVPYGNAKRMLIVRDISRLNQLEQIRRDFVANVSHELRSPLTVVVGYLESMSEDERLPEAFRRPVAQMAQQSARMTRIVEDLLRLSRIESDPKAPVQAPIRMGDLVDAMLRDAQRISTGKHVLEHNVDAGLVLLGDYNEIYSALSNLVFNAVQYTPAGGTITLNWIADAHGARFEVHDTGEGIEAHHVPRLTERFYRVDKARSRQVGGTGLGLAIVKHILMRHDARLQISSEAGKGSVFSCEFPASRVRSEAAQLPAQVAGSCDDASATQDDAASAEAPRDSTLPLR